MIDAVEPLSLVLWGVFFLAAGMYPLGFMLGAPCSPCCGGGDCEPLFHRCLRQKSVGGSIPTTPSKTIYFLSEAGIIKASSTASATLGVNIQPHGYLSAGESVVYTVPVKGYGESYGAGVECESVSGTITVRVEGRDFPLRFRDVFLGTAWAGSAISISGIAGVIDDDRSYNLSASVSSSIVGATVASEYGGDVTQYLNASEVTDAVLRGMLTVSQPYFEAWSDVVRIPKINVSLSGEGALFRYIQSPCIVTWLVRVVRGSATTHFRVAARVNPASPPQSVPQGMSRATIPPLANVTETPMPDDITPVVTDTSVLAKGHMIRGHFADVPVTLSLSGRCTVDVRSFYFGEFTATGTVPPSQLGQLFYATGSFTASRPLDKHVFRMEHLVNEPAGEEYDFDKVTQYRNGAIKLPVSYRRLKGAVFVTDHYEMQIVDPSPLCGLGACELPQDLLPQGITYTPAAGIKWDCKDAYPIVLGNPRGGCFYSHTTNECRGTGSAGVWLPEFFTIFTLPLADNGYPGGVGELDALTWLEFTPGVVTKPNGTYEIKGTYNAGAGRYGRCYTAGSSNSTFLPDVGGVCQPAEYTVTLGAFVRSGGGDPGAGGEWLDQQVQSFQGDYVLTPQGGGCWESKYSVSVINGNKYIAMWLLNFHGTQYSGVSPLYAFLYANNDFACNAVARQAVALTANVRDTSFSNWGRGSGGIYHSPAMAFEEGYSNATLPMSLTGGSFGDSATYTFSLSTEAGSPMTQCNNVTFSPTTVTGEAGNNMFISIGTASPETTHVAVAGEYAKCGYGVLYSSPGGFEITEKFINAEKSSSDLTQTVRRTLLSDGSPPQVLTITLPGKCQSIATTTGHLYGNPVVAPADGGCVVITAIPNGQSCEWTASGGAEWAVVDEKTQSGAGAGLVKVNVAPIPRFSVRRCSVTLALSSDPTKSVQAYIYQAG